MKINLLKSGYVVAIFIIVLTLLGCGQKSDKQVATSTESNGNKEMQLVNDGKLTFAMSGLLKPLNYKENNKLVGFDVEIGEEIAKRIGLEANPVTNPWETIIQGLKGHKYDAIIGSMTATEERAKQVDFSKPYYISGAQIFVGEDNTTIQVKDDLKDKKIGVMQASTYEEDAKQYTSSIKLFSSDIYALQDIPTGRLDAVITDRIVGLSIMNETGLKVKAVDDVIKREEIAVAVNKGNEKLLEAINQAIADMVEDGTYEKISMKWFNANLLEK
ncbi:ABC transporter substrate-binding protein [Lysinibacillus sp. FJAT-14745]|uniref:ABC transporter substrate-binding protein n=1 Tax=Lysinibacillus sp. FJAT-14745 TaxID=1704289 RepID=UPI0006ABED81|nr:ABC transporter substrate-binding protein [Lysinibacillus sp. FJAT-14745]KOP78404.1 ABC transporter substrate-binding protein [Lysinibacillus sp. FJAT-14745]